MKRIILMGIAIMAIFVSSCKKEEVETPKAINNVKEINKRTVVVSEEDMMPLVISMKKINEVFLTEPELMKKLANGEISEDEAFEKLSLEKQGMLL